MISPSLIALMILPPGQTSTDVTPQALAAALRALDGGRPLTLTGAVSEEQPDGDARADGVMMLDEGTGATPFAGAIEVLLTERGELLIASARRELPEVVVYDDGERLLVRTTVEDEPVGAARLADDLASLLDLSALASFVEKADGASAGPSGADGACIALVELSTRAVRAQTRGMLEMFSPRVQSVQARFELDARGAVQALRLAVTRSDPMAGMRERALEGGPVMLPEGELDHGPGPTSFYELRLSQGELSERARETLAAMRRLAEER